MRMVVDGEKIFPHADYLEVDNQVDQFLQFNVQVPAGKSFSIEGYSATGGPATLDYLSVIEIDTLDHS